MLIQGQSQCKGPEYENDNQNDSDGQVGVGRQRKVISQHQAIVENDEQIVDSCRYFCPNWKLIELGFDLFRLSKGLKLLLR